MSTTTDPNDPRLKSGADTEPTEQAEAYLVLSEEERRKGFVRPLRESYIHTRCGGETRMAYEIAETYARDPKFYDGTLGEIKATPARRPGAIAEWQTEGMFLAAHFA